MPNGYFAPLVNQLSGGWRVICVLCKGVGSRGTGGRPCPPFCRRPAWAGLKPRFMVSITSRPLCFDLSDPERRTAELRSAGRARAPVPTWELLVARVSFGFPGPKAH